MNFKKSQRAEIASIIRQNGLEPNDFSLVEKEVQGNAALIVKHTATDAIFAVDALENHFGVLYAPSDVSLKPVRSTGVSWESAMNYLSSWVRYVKEESEAEDPWDNQTQEEFDQFHNDSSKFTPEELERLDKAIDSSFDYLTSVAEENGYTLTDSDMVQISKDIKFLKNEARSNSKRKWLDLFMGTVIGRLLEWGLSSALVGAIFAKLIEMSHEVLKLTTYVPPNIP